MRDEKGFDLWADGYDKDVQLSEENGEYPFAGYKEVLGNLYRRVRQQGGTEVMDIGFGTGTLSSRLYRDGCKITGLDFSEKMIGIAQPKMPEADLIQWDFSTGLPESVENRRFDDVLSTYAFHHLTDEGKAKLIRTLWNVLKPGGKIMVGDVSFRTVQEREACREKFREIWDENEHYFAFEELCGLLKGIPCSYLKISHCAGVLTVTRK
jgi:putative AdoMet-dependent methyltransferase